MIIGASFDSPRENRAFRDKFDFPFDLLSDEDRKVGIAYGVAQSTDATYPARVSYLIDSLGRIEHVFAHVDPSTHPEQVLAVLDET